MIQTRALAIFVAGLLTSTALAEEPNTLSTQERAAGWRLLFDGKTTKGWEGKRDTPFPFQSWAIEDGAIRTLPDGSGGDLLTVEQFDSFELRFEWKLSEDGNSGVKYVVQKEWAGPHFLPGRPSRFRTGARQRATGLEYQLLDDSKLDRGDPDWALSSCGSLYLLVAPGVEKDLKPTGQWNRSRIVLSGNHGEHWLNGKKLLEFELGSKELLEQVDRTKFLRVPGYGKKGWGYIALTHHGSPVWYRSIAIREITE